MCNPCNINEHKSPEGLRHAQSQAPRSSPIKGFMGSLAKLPHPNPRGTRPPRVSAESQTHSPVEGSPQRGLGFRVFLKLGLYQTPRDRVLKAGVNWG